MAAPPLGEHNKEILKELLNYDDEMIKDLVRKGVISCLE
jgi:crotonobetainyl-CoA:carnitine CoA-transferase CaiB-like acyl-CoA transferase